MHSYSVVISQEGQQRILLLSFEFTSCLSEKTNEKNERLLYMYILHVWSFCGFLQCLWLSRFASCLCMLAHIGGGLCQLVETQRAPHQEI